MTVAEDLRYLRAVAVSNCELAAFRGWADIDIDEDNPVRDQEMHVALEVQFWGKIVNFNTESLAAAMRNVYKGQSIDQLLRACTLRTVNEPLPPPPPPDPIFPEPGEPDPGPPVTGPGGAPRRIAIVNLSSASDSQVRAWEYGWAWQMANHYAPYYGHIDVVVGEPGEGDIRHEILDTAEIPAGGYHTVDDLGNPIARTFLDSGQPSVVGSHENLEVAYNGWVNGWWNQGFSYTRFYWAELCDPVQRITYPAPNGEMQSDFILPAWMGHWNERDPHDLHAAARFAGISVLTEYQQIARGGYMGVLDTDANAIEFVFGAAPGLEALSCKIRHDAMIKKMHGIADARPDFLR